jgi:hypothetical protein
MMMESVKGPTLTIQHKPGKELALAWHLSLPNLAGAQNVNTTKKESDISRRRGVNAIGRPLPDKPVGHQRQPHGSNKIPDGEELDDDLHGQHVRNISDPTDPTGSRTEALEDSE